ncbi:MAG: DMT family transporter [Anaerolineae bacterium]|nr:DMT family transporter [Anaerolineae bacterium]
MVERKVWLAFLLLALAWGTSFMFIKIAVQTLQPVTVVAWRLAIGSLGLLAVLRLRNVQMPRKARIWRHIAVIGLVNVAIPFVLIVWAESGAQGLDSGVASIVNSTVPLFSIVIAGLFMRMERVTGTAVFGLLAGFGGVVLLMSRDAQGSRDSWLPYLAVLVAAFCYAAGSAYARRYLRGVAPVALALGQLAIAAAIVFVASLVVESWSAQAFPLPTVLALLWLGLVGSTLAYILYFFVLQQWGATRTTLVTYLVPVVGLSAGILFLNEPFDWRLLAGGGLILSGVATVNLRPA